MALITYNGSCNGQDVPIKLDLNISSQLISEDGSKEPLHKAHIAQFAIDDIELFTLSEATFGMLEKIMTIPNNPGMGAKKAI